MSLYRALFRRLAPLLLFLAAIWATHLVNIALGGALTDHLGLTPRRLDGLDGVLAMPFLHGDFEHLIANTTPLLILGGLITLLAPRAFWPATAICLALGGVLIWLFARSQNHIGASALVFGWFGFLVAWAFIERSAQAGLGALIAILAYGAQTVLGLAPTDERVSWDGHLAGLIAGIVAAWSLRPRRARRRGSLNGAGRRAGR